MADSAADAQIGRCDSATWAAADGSGVLNDTARNSSSRGNARSKGHAIRGDTGTAHAIPTNRSN